MFSLASRAADYAASAVGYGTSASGDVALSEEEAAAAQQRWEEAIAQMRLGIAQLFSNDFTAAEATFRRGMGDAAPASTHAFGAAGDAEQDEDDEVAAAAGGGGDRLDKRDVRGAFALMHAMVAVLRGIASLANDQLDECMARLQAADALACRDCEWVGKPVVRGVCTLAIGLVQCMQHQLVAGAWNILRSWQWIKHLKGEALEYDGVGREVVRCPSRDLRRPARSVDADTVLASFSCPAA